MTYMTDPTTAGAIAGFATLAYFCGIPLLIVGILWSIYKIIHPY